MPIERSIDKIVSTVSLNVTVSSVDPRIDYFSANAFLQSYLLTPSIGFTPASTPQKITFNNNLNYIDYFNLYLDIPYEIYEGFPNILNRISIRVLPHSLNVPSLQTFTSSSQAILIESEIASYNYIQGHSYVYFSSENSINYLNEVDDLILAWNSSNNKVFEYIPEEVPPELPPAPDNGGTGLKEFWA